MPKPAEILLQRIDERLKIIGRSRYWLSKQLTDGKRHGVITDIERKSFLPSEPRLRHMAELLETTTDYLMGRVDNPAQVLSEVSFRAVPLGLPAPGYASTSEPLKLVGTGFCADLVLTGDEGETLEIEQILLEADHTLRLLARPPALLGAADAYAIYFQGSSMERRFYQGEIGVIDPRRPPSPGHVVLVQLSDGNGPGVIHALVKELVRVTSGYVELLQYNPEIRFRVPRERVVRMDRVYRPDELLLGP